MKNLFTLLIATAFVAISCNSKDINNSQNSWKFDSLTVSKKVYINNDSTKDGMLIELNLVYPTSVSGNLNLKKTQNVFARIMLATSDFQGTPQEAFDKILTDYTSDAEELAKEMENEDSEFTRFSDFEYNKSCKLSMETEELITVASSDYSYTGGAHGLFGVGYYNIDKNTGDLIDEEQFFKSGYKEKLAALIQNAIEERNNSSDDENSIELLDDLKNVKPNRNFYFSNEGIVYVYNIYEIAPYSQGTVEVTVPYIQISSLINDKYLPIIENLK